MAGRNFSLTEHLSGFVDDQVSSGRHQNASEVVREALRRYEDDILTERASLVVIEKVANAGARAMERGDFKRVQGTEGARAFLKQLNERASRRASERAAGRPVSTKTTRG